MENRIKKAFTGFIFVALLISTITIFLSIKSITIKDIPISKEEDPIVVGAFVYEAISEEELMALIHDMQNAHDNKELEERIVDEKVDHNTYENPKPQNSPSYEKAEVDASPITGECYTVKNGDTLYFIAQRAKVSVEFLKDINQLKNELIFTGQVLWIQEKNIEKENKATDSKKNKEKENDQDLYWLSRIIHAEAQGECYEGKVAVGNVVINRVKSDIFPNTIVEVVFDRQEGYIQFSPVLDGSIYNTPDEESISAAKAALNGERPVGEALYFLNPRKSTNFWIVENRKFYTTIGDHDFYY